jgi:hypothetical protein
VSDDLTRILIISDGKAGHLNQSLGLAEALAKQRPGVEIEQMLPFSRLQVLFGLLFGRCQFLENKPDLVIGAGHGTHLTLLTLKRCWHLPVILLMKPSIPMQFFDLCLIPEHDQPPKRANVIVTRGALNRVRPATKQAGTGIILIGGPSKNSDWDKARLIQQLEALVRSDPRSWLMTTSRRTPASTVEALGHINGIELFPVEETEAGWLAEMLASAEHCWVTEDSVSMIYEALSAGCSVGVFEVPWRSEGRLLKGVNKLKKQGFLTPFERWPGEPLPPLDHRFNETERCAKKIIERGLL